jgi:hypothetical protein
MPKHAVCIFSATAVDALRTTLISPEYDTGAELTILRDGKKFFLRVRGVDDDADPGDINDSRPCPGSPGCP